jgi:AraC-like DNA-binding protein
MLSGYSEFVPERRLRGQVVCFWHRRAVTRESVARVLPDGCVDVIWVDGGAPFVAGPATRAIVSRLEPGGNLTGVRLRPGVAHRLLGISAGEMRDLQVPLRDVWSREQCRLWDEVEARETLAERLGAIELAVQRRLAVTEEDDLMVSRAVVWLAGHPGGRVEELGRLLGLSERQVRRRFERAVGYGPKRLHRIMRLQFLLWLAGQGGEESWNLSGLALAAGYADQAHMTREVVALTGVSPGQLLSEQGTRCMVSDLYKTDRDSTATMELVAD